MLRHATLLLQVTSFRQNCPFVPKASGANLKRNGGGTLINYPIATTAESVEEGFTNGEEEANLSFHEFHPIQYKKHYKCTKNPFQRNFLTAIFGNIKCFSH